MKPDLRYTIILISLCMSRFQELQAQLNIDAQYRNRIEIRNGYRELTSSNSIPAFIISQRLRVSFHFQSEYLELRFTPQDVRIWGDEQLVSSTGVYGDYASLDLFEGYIELKAANFALISIGRQQLVYDNQRLLAARNWNQLGISYDALLAKITLKNWNLHLAGSWNTLKDALQENTYPANRIKSLNLFWLNRKFNEKLKVSLVHVASGITKNDTTNALYFRQTSGLYSEYQMKKLHIEGNIYFQYGKNRTGKKVGAWLLDMDASHQWADLKTGAGISYLSGNSKIGTAQITDRLFDVLYGARHRYFGYMDYFSNFGKHTGQGGIVDYYLYVANNFSESLSIQNTGHYFRLAQTNSSTPTNKNLGYENDLVLKFKFRRWGTLESGYAFILPMSTLRTIQCVTGSDFSQYVYLQLTVNPTYILNFK